MVKKILPFFLLNLFHELNLCFISHSQSLIPLMIYLSIYLSQSLMLLFLWVKNSEVIATQVKCLRNSTVGRNLHNIFIAAKKLWSVTICLRP